MRSKATDAKVQQPLKIRRYKVRRVRIAMILTAAILALSVGIIALPRSSSRASQKKYVATKKISIDAVTHELRKPTQEETDAIVESVERLTNRSTDGLSATTLPNGATGMDLQNRFQTVVVARANGDGSIETKCVTSIEEAAEFLGLVLADAPANDSPSAANLR
jgi:hypothetical protein